MGPTTTPVVKSRGLHFAVYALSVKTLKLPKDFDATAAKEAMKGKILAEGELLTVYTQNPAKGAKVGK